MIVISLYSIVYIIILLYHYNIISPLCSLSSASALRGEPLQRASRRAAPFLHSLTHSWYCRHDDICYRCVRTKKQSPPYMPIYADMCFRQQNTGRKAYPHISVSRAAAVLFARTVMSRAYHLGRLARRPIWKCLKYIMKYPSYQSLW